MRSCAFQRTFNQRGTSWFNKRNHWNISRQEKYGDISLRTKEIKNPKRNGLFGSGGYRQQVFNKNSYCSTFPYLQQHQLLHTRARDTNCLGISQNLIFQPEVSNAIENHRPVVALESTIVAHGMPFPQNYEVALEVEDILRQQDVVPATIAIYEGVPRIGLSKEELYDLARQGSKAVKCSTRDLPFCIGNNSLLSGSGGSWGATTVASTMVLANHAGIETFVTGGTGGVHRDGHNTLDISADLFELSRTPVVVVSAGIKSILDIQRTLEVLETYSVPVVSYISNAANNKDAANLNDFPAFFSPQSGVPSPRTVERPDDVSQMYWVGRDLKMSCGMLVSVPNPEPSEGTVVERAIQNALTEADSMDVRGRDVTPFILKRVAETTDGASLRSNIALVKNNAKVGADIAIAISAEKRRRVSFHGRTHSNGEQRSNSIGDADINNQQDMMEPAIFESIPPVIVVGGAVMDLMASPKDGSLLIPKTSNPGTCVESDGGVGRNIAEVLGRLNLFEQRIKTKESNLGEIQSAEKTNPDGVLLYSAVGDQDDFGQGMIHRLEDDCGVMTKIHNRLANGDKDTSMELQTNTTSTIRVISNARTATYLALLDEHRDLFAAIADMDVLHHVAAPPMEVLRHPSVKCLVVDSNPPPSELVVAVSRANASHLMVVWEPTSVPKAVAVACHYGFLENVSIMTPNADELMAMSESITTSPIPMDNEDSKFDIQGDFESSELSLDRATSLVHAALKLLPRMKKFSLNDKDSAAEASAHVVITLGKHGVLHCIFSSKLAKGADETIVPQLEVIHYPVPKKIKVENCTGAGDTLTGALVHALVVKQLPFPEALPFAMNMALESLVTPHRAIGLKFSFSPIVDHF